MKLLVTGGADLIGSDVSRHIIQDVDDSVANVYEFTYAGNPENVATVAGSEPSDCEQVDICHMRGCSHLSWSGQATMFAT